MKIQIWCSLVLGVLALAACSKSGPPVRESASPSVYESNVDSLALEIFSIAQDTVITPLLSTWLETQEVTAPVDRVTDTGADAPIVYYRVQLRTTKDLAKAVAVRDKAEFDFGMTVRVDFETPYYKVRVGQFAAPADAAALLGEARRLGYPGAWTVRVRALDVD